METLGSKVQAILNFKVFWIMDCQ